MNVNGKSVFGNFFELLKYKAAWLLSHRRSVGLLLNINVEKI